MWANWAGDQRCSGELRRPGSVEEVAREVRAAAAAGRTVRVAGAGHSFSDAVLTDGLVLSLDRVDRIVDVDRAAGLVRVQAGRRLHDLNRALAAEGLALPNLGDIETQALGGALATGTHGTGIRRHNLSAQVVAAQIVTGDGSVREVGDGDLLRAVRVSTGSLGVVTEVTLRCVPSFHLRGVDRREPLEEVLESLDERVGSNDHFELFTFPHSRWALTRTNTIAEAPGPPPAWRRQALRAQQFWLDNVAFEALLRAGRRAPSRIPRLNRLAGRLAGTRDRTAPSYEVFASPRLIRFTEMEYAVPRERAAEALREVRAVLERHPVSFPVELRFLGADDALLSMSAGRDSAYLACHVYRGMPFEAPLREVEALMARFDGRPHWGKRSWLAADELAPRYPHWDAFQAARAELDPGGTFQNAYARRMLGPMVTGSSVPRRDTSEPSR